MYFLKIQSNLRHQNQKRQSEQAYCNRNKFGDVCQPAAGIFRGHFFPAHSIVIASSPSHQVLGSKPSLCRISTEVRLCFGYSLPQTPLVWEPLSLGLPLFFTLNCDSSKVFIGDEDNTKKMFHQNTVCSYKKL
jgi:hypothetical protein